MQEPIINVGILGLGRAGWDIHVSQLRQHPRYRITDVADPDPGRREQAAAELKCTSHASLEDMLARGQAEVIVVATPNVLHEQDALQVLEAGKHCVVEKPVALSYQGAYDVAQRAAELGQHLFAHHQLLFANEYRFLRELIDSSVLGEVFEIRFSWVNYARRNDWQTLKANGGGLLNNHGPHAFSLLQDLLDARVEDMTGGISHIKDAGDADDHVHFLMRAANGRTGDVLLSTSCALPQPRFTIMGRNGTAMAIEGGKVKLRYYNAAKAPLLSVIDGAAVNRSYKNNDELPWVEEIRDLAPTQAAGTFYDNIAAVLRDGASMVVTPESAVEVARLLEWGRQGYDPAHLQEAPLSEPAILA